MMMDSILDIELPDNELSMNCSYEKNINGKKASLSVENIGLGADFCVVIKL